MFYLDTLIMELIKDSHSQEASFIKAYVKENSEGTLLVRGSESSVENFLQLLKEHLELEAFPVSVYMHLIETQNTEVLKVALNLTEEEAFFDSENQIPDRENGLFGEIITRIEQLPYVAPNIIDLLLLAQKAGRKINYIEYIKLFARIENIDQNKRYAKAILMLQVIDKKGSEFSQERIQSIYNKVFSDDFDKKNLVKIKNWKKLEGKSVKKIIDQAMTDFFTGKDFDQSNNDEILLRLLNILQNQKNPENIEFVTNKINRQIGMGGNYRYEDSVYEKLIELENKGFNTDFGVGILTSRKLKDIVEERDLLAVDEYFAIFDKALEKKATNLAFSVLNYMELEGKDIAGIIEKLSNKIKNFDIKDLIIIKDIVEGRYVDESGAIPISRPVRDKEYYQYRQQLDDLLSDEKDVIAWYESLGVVFEFKGHKAFGLVGKHFDKYMKLFAFPKR
jgi:hypothetical protein